MAVSVIKNLRPIVRNITVSVTTAGSGTGNENIYTLINADCPSGYVPLGIVGFTTNNQNVIVISARYVNGPVALQTRNLGSTAVTSDVVIYYLATPA